MKGERTVERWRLKFVSCLQFLPASGKKTKRNREKENDRACEGGARTRESPVKIESSPEERGLIEPIWGRPE